MTIIHVFIVLALAMVAAVLFFGLITMTRGKSPEASNRLMQMRVLAQFIALIVILLVVWFIRR